MNEQGSNLDLDLTCEVSGLERTRVNELGMFCNANPCVCEQESKRDKELFFATIKAVEALYDQIKRNKTA